MGSFTNKITAEFTPPKTWKLEEDLGFREGTPVSYTHLTLPTIYSV